MFLTCSAASALLHRLCCCFPPRDVSEDIRSIVIEAIGEWVEALPSEFLGDSYLKYLAWALSDRAPLVRLQAVKAITKLYSERYVGLLGAGWEEGVTMGCAP